MISALTWIPRGACREHPIRYELSEEEMKMMMKSAQNKQKNAADDIEQQGPLPESEEDAEDEDISELPAALRMDQYDAEDSEGEDDDEGDEEGEAPGEAEADDEDDDDDEMREVMAAGGVMEDVTLTQIGDRMYAVDAPNAEDGDEDDEEDAADNRIKATDNVLVTAVTTHEEQSELQVWVLTDENDTEGGEEGSSFYLHHDIVLPEIPLCLAWMDIPPFRAADGQQGGVGSYMAVGTFASGIEIWNLDVMDPLEPTATLGGEKDEEQLQQEEDEEEAEAARGGKKGSKKAGKKGKKGKKRDTHRPGSHTAAVMGLSWNAQYRQALASGSADHTVKVWDVTTQTCLSTFTHHTDKVQAVRWHPTVATLLATASFDKTVCLVDCLLAQQQLAAAAAAKTKPDSSVGVVATFSTDSLVDPLTGVKFTSDVECVQWNPADDNELFVSLENGYVVCFDRRKAPTDGTISRAATRCWQAHEKTAASISFSRSVPGMLCTASVDKTVKIWDTNTVSAGLGGVGVPRCVAYKTMGIGKVLAADYSYSAANTAASSAATAAPASANLEMADVGFLMACGGDGNDGAPAVWYSDELAELKNHFGSKRRGGAAADTLLSAGVVADTTPAAEVGEGAKKKKNRKKKDKKAGKQTQRMEDSEEDGDDM